MLENRELASAEISHVQMQLLDEGVMATASYDASVKLWSLAELSPPSTSSSINTATTAASATLGQTAPSQLSN